MAVHIPFLNRQRDLQLQIYSLRKCSALRPFGQATPSVSSFWARETGPASQKACQWRIITPKAQKDRRGYLKLNLSRISTRGQCGKQCPQPPMRFPRRLMKLLLKAEEPAARVIAILVLVAVCFGKQVQKTLSPLAWIPGRGTRRSALFHAAAQVATR